MPSVGAVTGAIVERRINAAIDGAYEGHERESMYKLLRIAREGGSRAYLGLAVVGILLSFTLLISFQGALLALGVAFLFLLLSRAALLRRNRARQEYHALLAANPEYWKPLRNKLVEIILEAGKFDDGLMPQQATKIVK